LDDLWQRPQHWRDLGQQGRAYVQARFGCQAAFGRSLAEAVHGLALPLAEHMRRQGLQRAADHDRAAWRERFGSLVEKILDNPTRPYCERVEVRPRTPTRSAAAEQGMVLVPVRVANRGTHAVVHEGPARMVVRSSVVDESGEPVGVPELLTSLPGIVMPGQEVSLAVRVPVPARVGLCRVILGTERAGTGSNGGRSVPEAEFRLVVTDRPGLADEHCCASLLAAAQAALAEAERRQRLPDDYTDVTEGFLAGWKRWLKRKLLGNFKHAYVDVLSRQQSGFNRQIVVALQELAECCTLLDQARATGTHKTGPAFPAAAIEQAVAAGKADELAGLFQTLLDELAASRRSYAALEERMARLEMERARSAPEADLTQQGRLQHEAARRDGAQAEEGE
jgi:hypothetical protein